MLQTLRWLFYGTPIVLFLCGIPLVARLVPPNRFYGFRTAASFSSAAAWYELNFNAGLVLLVAGAISALVVLFMTTNTLGMKSETQYLLGLIISGVCVGMLTIPLFVYADRF